LVTLGLFEMWEVTITGSIAFLLLVSFFLYGKRKRPAAIEHAHTGPRRFLEDFTFVWVLVVLLVFYIVTVDLRSFELFAVGNVIVELFLIYYILKSRIRS
jgi:hypothetical protein